MHTAAKLGRSSGRLSEVRRTSAISLQKPWSHVHQGTTFDLNVTFPNWQASPKPSIVESQALFEVKPVSTVGA